jgi:hypothetical protein
MFRVGTIVISPRSFLIISYIDVGQREFLSEVRVLPKSEVK